MSINRQLFLFFMLPAWLSAHGSECPVTAPNLEDPEGALASSKSYGWHGTDELAALIPSDGKWTGMGAAHNYRNKFWWWREGYSASTESKPELFIAGKRLDGEAPPVLITNTTSAYGENWNAMLALLEFPVSGCWEVVGTYRGRQLRLVFEVGGS